MRAKILVDIGAKVTVISENFANANGLGKSTLQTPAKLIMANGIIEPVFHKSHNLSLVVDSFRHKVSAFIAPIKNYDLILGRDNLLKLNAVIDVSGHVSVFDKRQDMRVVLEFGKVYIDTERSRSDSECNLEQNYISKEELERELQNKNNLMLFEISVEQINTSTDSELEKNTSDDATREADIKEKFKHLMRDELPDKLPPDRGLDHYIDLQGRLPKSAPRGFRLSEAELEFMQKYIKDLLDKGLIQPCLGPYASPILVVKKPNSTDLRCVIDYRKVNEYTECSSG